MKGALERCVGERSRRLLRYQAQVSSVVVLAVWILSAGGWLGTAVYADELTEARDESLPRSYADGSARKLGRGLANVLTAPLELVRVPTLLGENEGGIAALTVGIIQGFKASVIRAAVGVFEAATFFTPFPHGFLPILKPEFVYMHGDWVP